MNARSLVGSLGLTLTLTFALLTPRVASAYCRGTTCDPKVGDVCNRDVDGCVVGYPSLYWPSSCLTFAIQRDGSVSNQITGAAFEVAVHRAFDTWMNADCGHGTHPGIHVETLGLIECDQVEFNSRHANVNAYMFRDATWSVEPGVGDALGLTTAHFDSSTGAIEDVDVEINGTGANLTNADPEDGADLVSILTHETGHFLGLDHTRDANSVMFATYMPRVSDLRHLSADDTAGICALYPPNSRQPSNECRPLNGFSGVCAADQREPLGCSFAPSNGARSRSPKRELFGVGLLITLAMVRSKSRRRRRALHRAESI